MSEPSFLARRTWGTPNYFLIALALACVLAMVPVAVRRAMQTNSNRAEDWLPNTYTESIELNWFRKHFQNESFVLCSWDGCTLGTTAQLELLAEKLSEHLGPERPSAETIIANPHVPFEGPWFYQIATGPSMLDELTGPPLHLNYAQAIVRLEGAVVGPPAHDADGELLGDETRPTCLVAVISNEAYATNMRMRRALQLIQRTASEECGIPDLQFRLGGPTADNVAIDVAGEQSFFRLSALSGLVGLGLAWLCFRSLRFTGLVVVVGTLSASVSLAIVYYFGVGEVLLAGLPQPHLGKLDAVMMSMPAVVYILGISGAVHVINYYCDARREAGLEGAAERAVQIGWTPCVLAAVTTAVGLGSLATSDIVPIRKFGTFTGFAVLTTLGILFSLVPIVLHRFPPRKITTSHRRNGNSVRALPAWARAAAAFVIRRHTVVALAGLLLLVGVGLGLTQISSSVQLLKLLDPENDLIADYRWIEEKHRQHYPDGSRGHRAHRTMSGRRRTRRSRRNALSHDAVRAHDHAPQAAHADRGARTGQPYAFRIDLRARTFGSDFRHRAAEPRLFNQQETRGKSRGAG